MCKDAAVAQQIRTELQWFCLKRTQISGHHENCLKQHEAKWSLKVHRPLKVMAFNTNGIWRQRYELSMQLQELKMNVALFCEASLDALYSKLSPDRPLRR